MSIEPIHLILQKDTEYIFLIGAGASVASHIPDGGAMCKEILANTLIDFRLENANLPFEKRISVFEQMVQQFLDQGMTKYQSIMCAVRNSKDESWIARYIRQLILTNARRPKPDNRWIINNCYNVLANIISNRIRFSRMIITTNFDPLIYYAFIQNWDTEPVLIRSHNELFSMQPEQVKEFFPCLIFLHGYWHNHQVYNDPKQYESHRDKWINALSTSWINNDVIVIGYSGLEDNIAQKWLSACLKEGRTVWWCLYRPKSRKVSTSGIFLNNAKEVLEKCIKSYVDDKPDKKNYFTNSLSSELVKKLDEWLQKWDLGRYLSDADEKREIRSRLEHTGNNLKFVNIEDADSFALKLGSEMDFREAKDVQSAVTVFPWFHPNDVSKFENGASVNFEPILYESMRPEFEIKFKMGDDAFPGNNHGGINIDSVEHEINLDDLRKTNKCIRVYYLVREMEINDDSEVKKAIEFKLHSRKSAWSYLMPISSETPNYHDIPLHEFTKNGVDLTSVWRLVIAADVKGLGKQGKVKIRITKSEIVTCK